MHWRRKWQPTPVFLPGESQGQRSLVGCRLWGRTELDTTEATWQQGESFLVTSYSIADAYSPSDLELQHQEALYQKVLKKTWSYRITLLLLLSRFSRV